MTNVQERRTIRIDSELWDGFGEVARQLRTTRSEMIRSYLVWLLGKPGARPPARPALDSFDSGKAA